MSGWWNQLSSFTRLLAYAVVAVLVFGLAAGVGVMAAFVVSGNVSLPTGGKVRSEASSATGGHKEPAQPEQADSEPTQQQYTAPKPGQAVPEDGKTAYIDEVGEIQVESVDTFSTSHQLLLRYDALTAGDVEKMRADQADLERLADQAGALRAPQNYEEHKVLFRSAIGELHQATRLAYILAADPIEATQADFELYDRLVDEATADLQRSNEILGSNYKTTEGVRGTSPSQ